MMRTLTNRRLSAPLLVGLLGVLLVVGVVLAAQPVTVGDPSWVGGSSGGSDQRRDADVIPAVAYDPTTRQYLAVWLSPRRADSSGDGLDLIGVFLNQQGQPASAPFYISDNNNVARNARPAVAAAPSGRFAVAWTIRGRPCRIAAELVTSPVNQPDKVLLADTADVHAPDLIYQPSRQNFLLAFSRGEDYLPPKLMGANTADCGDNGASTARVELAEFAFINSVPMASRRIVLSGAHGAFRPRLARDLSTGTLLVVWEDRRAGSAEQPYRFDVYAQRLAADLSLQGSNIPLATESHYFLEDDSATWTPRPALAGSNFGFLVAWFDHQPQGEAHRWAIVSRFVSSTGVPGAPFEVARTTYNEEHLGNAPSGTLGVVHSQAAGEYLVGFTLYTESFLGYVSSALAQRVNVAGQLLRVDGSVLSEAGVGRSVDYSGDDQVFIALAANANSGPGTSDVLLLYSKQRPGGHSRDMEIFGARLIYPGTAYHYTMLPVTLRPR